MKLRIPIDFDRWPELVKMRSMNIDREKIVPKMLELWQWLGYMSMVDEIGFVRHGLQGHLKTAIGYNWFRNFCLARVLEWSDDDGGWWCKRFRLDHMHLDLNHETSTQAAELTRKHFKRLRGMRKTVDELSKKLCELNLGAEPGPEADIQAHKVMRRTIWLIAAIDSALGLPPRPLSHYSGAMLQCADAIVRETPEHQLQLIIAMLVRYRRSPKIPNVTELILQGWGDVCSIILGGRSDVRVQNLRANREPSQEERGVGQDVLREVRQDSH